MSRILSTPTGGGWGTASATPAPRPTLADTEIVDVLVLDSADDAAIPAGMVDACLTYRGGHFTVERIERGGERAQALIAVCDRLEG